MSLQIKELTPEVIGKRLGQRLFNSKGNLLIGVGTEIGSFHLDRIKEVGYKSIYVFNGEALNHDKTGHVLSEKLRASASKALHDLYRKFVSKNKNKISEAKKGLNLLADNLIRATTIKMEHPPNILDLKRMDDYLYQHAINVAAYAILIAQSMQYHQMKLHELALSALLCDFGMILLSSEILNKEGEFSEEEAAKMREHTTLGFQHLGRACDFKALISVVSMQHHERYDGTGYPNNRVGEDIHEYSRIITIADFFDAYTSDRPYRRMHTIEEALNYIRENAGTQFDPRIIRHFLGFFQ